jgi:pSer/pThr/pTyr-binding forkhead associated (FHA) protein
VFCNGCGHRNPSGANFCSSCGAALEHASGEDSTVTLAPVEGVDAPTDDDITVALDDLPEGLGLLVVKRGPNAGSKYTLDQSVTSAGRHPESDIFLDDITVSRRHAEFRRAKKGYKVADVGSLNGTYLNRGRIDEAALSNGDEVQIGKFRLVFLTGTSTDS